MAFVNASDVYFGDYARFSTADKNVGALLAGPDNAIGDIGEIEFVLDENKQDIAWLKNRFGKLVGKLDGPTSHRLAILKAKGWNVLYVLSFVAFSEKPDSSQNSYWGEVAIIAFSPRVAKEFLEFLNSFVKKASAGERPNPALTDAEVNQILSNPSSWTPSQKIPLPAMDANTILVKDTRSMHDKLLDQGRNKNPGCYLISWAFIFLLGAGAAWLLHSWGIL